MLSYGKLLGPVALKVEKLVMMKSATPESDK